MKRTSSNNVKQETASYDVKVVKVKEFDNAVAFDMEVNNVTIYGCFWRKYTNKEGIEGDIISLPSKQGKDGKYYSHVFFPITKAMREDIIDQIESML